MDNMVYGHAGSQENGKIFFDVDFNILTALKGWVGHAPQGRGALQNHRLCALHIFIIII
jgi:hypothetical protein